MGLRSRVELLDRDGVVPLTDGHGVQVVAPQTVDGATDCQMLHAAVAVASDDAGEVPVEDEGSLRVDPEADEARLLIREVCLEGGSPE